METLTGKVAVVTGAATGIGLGISKKLAKEGARVVLGDIDAPGLSAAVAAISEAGGTAVSLAGDVREEDYHLKLAELALSKFGSLTIAVNNAGITLDPLPVGEVSFSDWKRIVDINLNGTFLGMKSQIASMLKSGGGAIVNMASVGGTEGKAKLGPYVATKHGVIGLTRCAALEYARQGIRVNSVAPGFIRTRLLDQFPAEAQANLAEIQPINRIGEVEEVADLVCYLASDRAAFITGSNYPIDGGTTAGAM